MRPNTARHERETSRTDRASWPLTPDALPWPTPGNEDAINSNPRLYGATRPTRTAGDGSYARAVPHVPHEQDPLAHLFPSPVSTVHLPDSHFAFTDRSGEVDKLYDHHADSRRQTPNWSYRKARAPVYYDVPHDLELHDDGSRMKRERSRSRSAHVRQDSGNGERARSTSRGRRSSTAKDGERGRRSARSSSSGVLPRARSRSASTMLEEERRSRAGRRPSANEGRNVHGLEEDPLLDVDRAFREEAGPRGRHDAPRSSQTRSSSASVSPSTAHRRALASLNGEDDLESGRDHPASSSRSRHLASFDGITSPRLVPNDVHERRPFRSRITGREWKVGGGVLLVIVLCSVGGWAAWFFGTGQQNKA
ncbi:uncharacterized protein RHOBADRAFT_52206 [Rhodotorula graminis WP1]|uniref:Uncharacterized protein n=1 Tax=Rhodotorula graminis (strain WP1) TaxID=578459 RepID=A0A194S6E3_RHOGW|nr:uncharacterized protein RHOBADRAFT_52206 [Rhodotorula graminis WP1]KPV76162.1 hypothetical protein RHOBADRAFT_52206 [Rhodotorula graminis WP1]